MSLPRMPIKTLMGYIASAAVLMVAVAHPDLGWVAFLSVFHGILLFTAILGIILRRGPERAFWIGFALFGWGSFLVGTLAIDAPPARTGLGYLATVTCSALNDLTNYLLSNLGPKPSALLPWVLPPGSAERITRMIVFSMVMAILGGQIGRILYIDEPADPTPTTPA